MDFLRFDCPASKSMLLGGIGVLKILLTSNRMKNKEKLGLPEYRFHAVQNKDKQKI